jgi:hypothetical protein
MLPAQSFEPLANDQNESFVLGQKATDEERHPFLCSQILSVIFEKSYIW